MNTVAWCRVQQSVQGEAHDGSLGPEAANLGRVSWQGVPNTRVRTHAHPPTHRTGQAQRRQQRQLQHSCVRAPHRGRHARTAAALAVALPVAHIPLLLLLIVLWLWRLVGELQLRRGAAGRWSPREALHNHLHL